MRRLLAAALTLPLIPAVCAAQSFGNLNPATGGATFKQGVDADGNFKTLFTGATNGSICYGIVAMANDNTNDHQLVFRVNYGVSPAPVVPLDVAQLTIFKTSGVPALIYGQAIPVLYNPIWPSAVTKEGNAYVELLAGETLQATYHTVLAASSQVNIAVQCGSKP